MIDNYPRTVVTKRGDMVRSKFEKVVADFFYFLHIDYIYEKLLVLSDGVEVHPDFYLPKFNIYIEVWGMKNDKKYDWKRGSKRAKYRADNNINLIELWPNDWGNYRWWLKVRFQEKLGIPFPAKNVPYYRHSL